MGKTGVCLESLVSILSGRHAKPAIGAASASHGVAWRRARASARRIRCCNT